MAVGITSAAAPTCDITLQNLAQFPEGRRIWTCIQCGTCVGTCPYGDTMEYPPRRMIAMLRAGLIEQVFRSESLLNCVACYACMAKCPRDIALTDVLLPLMKEQALLHDIELPGELQRALQNTLRYGNPMGESSRKRAAWIKTVDVPVRIFSEDPRPADVLWIVECYPAYYPRGQDAAQATARLMHALGIDFAVLGNEEKCIGECGRLTWEPGLYETLIDYNLAILARYRFERIVTGCPHAYNAMLLRYPNYGFRYRVQHTVELLIENLDRLKPLLRRKLDYTVTFHDSCCVGRRHAHYEEPRRLLSAIPGVKLVEMAHNRVNSICCGGGGGGMWLDTYYKLKGYERLSERRVKEAIATGADVLAVVCDYEVSRFEDALKVFGYDKRMVVRDITELLAEALET